MTGCHRANIKSNWKIVAPVGAHLFRIRTQDIVDGQVVEKNQYASAGMLNDGLNLLRCAHGDAAGKSSDFRTKTPSAIKGYYALVHLPVLIRCECFIFIKCLVLVTEPLKGDAVGKEAIEKIQLAAVGVLCFVENDQRKSFAQAADQVGIGVDGPVSQRDHIGETVVAIVCYFRLKLLQSLTCCGVSAGLPM